MHKFPKKKVFFVKMHKFPKKKDCEFFRENAQISKKKKKYCEFFRENARFCNIYWRCVSVQPPPKRNDDRLVACVFPIIIKVYTSHSRVVVKQTPVKEMFYFTIIN